MKLLEMVVGLTKKKKVNHRDFNMSVLKDEFYMCILEALKEFALSEDNKDVYALVFDCDSDVGVISLRYRNKQHFFNAISEYEKYNKKYGWDIYGLHGSEYEPGEFPFIEYTETRLVKHFSKSYYYHEVGTYYGDGEPLEDIKDNYRELFWELIIETIERLKKDISGIGIDTTDDFIFFHCDHDQSYEDRDKMIRMTVDEETIQRIGKLSADENRLSTNKYICLIKEMYNNNILLNNPLQTDDSNLPTELLGILRVSDGIKEVITIRDKKESIGWILYSYDMIKNNTEFYAEKYGINGYVFSDDGAGNVFIMKDDGAIYLFNAIDNEEALYAKSLIEFWGDKKVMFI